MKKIFFFTLVFIFICGMQISFAQKIDNAGLEGNWIGLMSFEPKDTLQVIIKGKSIEIKETLLSDNSQGNAVESSSLVKYELRNTTYLDKDKKMGYFTLYQAERKKYNLFTFLKKEGGEFLSGAGSMKHENDNEKAMLEEFDKELQKSKEELLASKIEAGIDIYFTMGIPFRKKEQFESLLKLPNLAIGSKEDLLKEMDKLIVYAQTQFKNSPKLPGYFGIFRAMNAFEKVAIANKLNPYSYYTVFMTEGNKYQDDPAVKAKAIEFEQAFGVK